jgi:DNA-binding NtrC family response regulator
MRAERVIESGRDGLQRSSVEGAAPQLRIARPERNRVQNLVDLAQTLLREAEALACDKQFTDESNRIHALNISEGIDFYREIERFEISLIKLALDQTGGHQARAARLLKIRPTTLHSKIKLYGIEY